ncbi:hypothetical protein [Actinoplanes palleronii]|uniref:Uncharacterized protein n=1 Tax=Actinoplanes palleronii TaxID=113570 RepID=A0ABQ4B415_9ACTN|nr:hypothetical protein [Actinoplanes palleronii]GIE65409.1 hypothetical protein Apa02nite_015170 [Actinoplanes palleronii]
MSDTAVVFNVLARDRASKVFKDIRKAAQDGSSGIKMAFGPALMPVLATATAGVVGLGAALSGAGAGIGVFGAVAKSAFTEISEASTKTQDLRDKIELLTEQAKVAEQTGLADAGKIEAARDKALSELMARYNLMPPALRKVTMAYDGMKSSWKGFVDQNKPKTYAIMTTGFNTLSAIIPKLQPLFDVGAAAAARFAGWLQKATATGGIDRLVSWLTDQAGPAIDNLARIGKNMGITIGAAFKSTVPAGQGLLKWLGDASEKAANFAKGGGFERFMSYVDKSGPGVVSTLSNLASAAMNIARAVTPLAPVSLAIASALTALVAAAPPGVITALVSAWVAYSVAVKAYHAGVLVVGVATKAWSAAQLVLNGAMVAANFVRATAQIAAYLIKVGAVKVATLATAAAQAVWNAALIAANFVAATAQIAAYLVKQLAVSIATRAWAAAQWLLNAAIVAANFAGAVLKLAAYLVTQGAIAVATKGWAAAQWLLNVAMNANPISLVIIAVVALIAIFAVLWTKSAAFRNFWIGLWNTVRSTAAAAWTFVRNRATSFYNWIIGLPGRVSSRLSSMFNGLWSGFKSVANRIIAGWNNMQFSIGGGSFMGYNVPSFSVGTPDIPYLAKGGNVALGGAAVVGEKGPELVSLRKGAQVTPLKGGTTASGMGDENTVTIYFDFGGSEFGQLMTHAIRTQPAVAGALAKQLRIKVK